MQDIPWNIKTILLGFSLFWFRYHLLVDSGAAITQILKVISLALV